jgi:hypothetical protein
LKPVSSPPIVRDHKYVLTHHKALMDIVTQVRYLFGASPPSGSVVSSSAA